MDLPIHLATGALIGNIILYAEKTWSQAKEFSHQQIKIGTVCFLMGVLSHLFWDAVPHYDWLFYIEIFKPLPFWWHIPQVIVAIPVVLFTWSMMHDHPVIALISMLGGIFPDLEKLAYFDFHLPRELVIFRYHSCYLSQWRSWELEHKTFLIVFEVLLLPALLVLMYWITCQRHNQMDSMKPGVVHANSLVCIRTDESPYNQAKSKQGCLRYMGETFKRFFCLNPERNQHS